MVSWIKVVGDSQPTSVAFDVAGAAIVIATMHRKEEVISAAFEGMGAIFLPSPQIDTDQFGTFSGETERTGSQLDAAKAKAVAGLKSVPEAKFAISSEGSFGPYPKLPVISGGIEMVMLLERDTGSAIVGYDVTAKTNYAHAHIETLEEALNFANRVGFPEHALVLFARERGLLRAKGIGDREFLVDTVLSTLRAYGSAWLETDMRALHNPTRMASIRRAADHLVAQLRARCPECGYPGWIPRFETGRPCRWCGGATHDLWAETRLCTACGNHERHILEPERKADPAHCGECNP